MKGAYEEYNESSTLFLSLFNLFLFFLVLSLFLPFLPSSFSLRILIHFKHFTAVYIFIMMSYRCKFPASFGCAIQIEDDNILKVSISCHSQLLLLHTLYELLNHYSLSHSSYKLQ